MGDFIYGLAVALLLFEGIIIQCEGGGGAGGSKGPSSSNQGKNVQAIFNNLSNEPENVRNDFFKNCIIFIQTKTFDDIDSELEPGELFASYEYINDDVKLSIGDYGKLVLFLKNYGKHVKKIHIEVSAVSELKIIPLVLKDYATNLEELQALSFPNDKVFWDFWNFWSEISRIRFPKVKTFRMEGKLNPTDFDLKSIFPELKYLSLDGDVGEKCLNNVKDLVELTLKTTSIPEGKFDSIFQKNNGITMIHLKEPKMRETMQSIAKHLQELKELVVSYPGKNFLLQAKNAPKCVLRNVKKFTIIFDATHNVYEIEKLTFVMPKLQELNFHGKFDGRFLQFIKHFERLDTLRLPNDDNSELLQLVSQTWIYSKYTHIENFGYIEFKKPGK